jgi:hypothetical protein
MYIYSNKSLELFGINKLLLNPKLKKNTETDVLFFDFFAKKSKNSTSVSVISFIYPGLRFQNGF